LYVNIPENRSQKIDASLVLEFFMAEVSQPLILDFHPDERHLTGVFHKAEALDYKYKNGHIIIDKKHFEAGHQQLEFHFTIPEEALSKNENYLMIKPATAYDFLAFPAFKQVDLPGSFLLNMEIPSSLKALSNAPILREALAESRKSVSFAKTPIIALTEFSFVVGKFKQTTAEISEKPINFFYTSNIQLDSIALMQYAKAYMAQDTATVSMFGVPSKTALLILNDLELTKTLYLPGLVYIKR
jgi:hypothetical protein